MKKIYFFLLVSLVIANLSFAQNYPTKLRISYPARIYINYGPKFSLTVIDSAQQQPKLQVLLFETLEQVDSMGSKFNPDYKIYHTGDELIINSKTGSVNYLNNLLKIKITLPTLSKIEINSAGLLEISGNFNLDQLYIENNGASSIKIGPKVKIRSLSIEDNGAGVIKLETNHTVNYAKIEINGAGIFNALTTPIENLDAVVDGASYCSVNVTNNLIAKVSGFSIFVYKGQPHYKKIQSDGLVFIKQQ